MKRPLIITAACALACAGSVAQINSPDAQGYLERGILMCDDRNFEGCLDQMSRLHNLTTTPQQRELAHYYMGRATLGLDVMMMVGDWYFNRGQYAEALTEYAQVDPLALTSYRQDELNYRQAYSYLMLGEPDAAASLFRTLQSKPEWKNAARY